MVIAISLGVSLSSKQQPSGLSNDPLTKAKQLQSKYPMIDGHNDLPYRFRDLLKNKITQVNLRQLQDPNSYNTDIPRLRQGYVGAQFWSVYTPCSAAQKDAVRMTLEQIDVVNRMVQLYPDVNI